jgi:novobiocin biosynthesis protein NovU/D-mycarose 3-C-methyltransferase
VKQGRYTPGNHLPILAPEELLRRRPHAVLLLTWNFAEEICRQQRAYLEAGGTFLVPVPAVRAIP